MICIVTVSPYICRNRHKGDEGSVYFAAPGSFIAGCRFDFAVIRNNVPLHDRTRAWIENDLFTSLERGGEIIYEQSASFDDEHVKDIAAG